MIKIQGVDDIMATIGLNNEKIYIPFFESVIGTFLWL